MNRIINEAVPDLPDNTKQVLVYYIDIDNEKELLKFIDEYNNTETKIVLRDLKEILDEVVINDIVEYEIKVFNRKDAKTQEKDLASLRLSGKEFYEIEITKFISDRLIQKINEYNQKKGLNKSDFKTLNEPADEEAETEETDDKPKKTKFKPIEISETGLELIELISIDCTTSAYSWTSDCELKIDKNGYLITDSKKSKDFWNGKIICTKKPLRMKIRNIAGDETIVDFK
jgi:adenine-specific DNA-methyltransferase